MRSRTRAVVVWVLASTALFGVARAVALPEACDALSVDRRSAAIDAAITWIVDNQGPDGRFLYRYDVVNDRVEPGYNWVRHAGTMLALAQASVAGHDVPVAALDAARSAIDDRLVTEGGSTGVRDGSWVSTGGTALLLLALTESEPLADEALVRSLGAHLRDSIVVGSDGVTRVLELADERLEFVPDLVGRFTTGEVAFALARLERLWPGEGWRDPLPGIFDYLARHKADEEGFVPDMADHWAAYALAESTRWVTSPAWSDLVVSWARKQMGLSSVMIRFEGQRTNGAPDVWLRGRPAVGSAVGTHGEAMAGWTRFFAWRDDDESAAAGRARLACNNAILVERQSDPAAPARVAGSWTWRGVTQVDDQQHAISALLAGEALLSSTDDPRPSRRQPLDWSWPLVVLAVFATTSPSRWAGHLVAERRTSRRVILIGGALLLVLAALSPPLLAWVAVSVPTAAVATGVVVVLAGVMTVLGVHRGERPFMAVARPELILLAVTTGAAGRSWAFAGGLVLAAVAAEALRATGEDVQRWVVRAAALWTVAIGVALIVNGVYSV